MTLGGVHSLKQTVRPWKWMVGRWNFFLGRAIFRGKRFVSGRVYSSFLRKTTPFFTPKSPAGEAIGCQPENPREQRMSTWFHGEPQGLNANPPTRNSPAFLRNHEGIMVINDPLNIYLVILRILGFFSSSFSRKKNHPWPLSSPSITR